MALEALAPLFIPGGLGPPELIVILLIFVLLFGANKIPELARSTGEAMGEFQKGREQVETELEEMKEEATPDMDQEDFVDTDPVVHDDSGDAATEQSTGSSDSGN